MIEKRVKAYYSIGEVCSITDLEPHVLRYWETEFPQLRPKKNRAGNRAYRAKDIELIQTIKKLLHEEKYTIPGAKKKMGQRKNTPPVEEQPDLFTQPLESKEQNGVIKSNFDKQQISEALKQILSFIDPKQTE